MKDTAMPQLRRALLLETSGRQGLVGLAEGDRLEVRSLSEARRHARDLALTVQQLFTDWGWTANDVEGVIVSIGPGSFTGLRVGVMSAKVFAYASGCALIAVPTFTVIAQQALEEVAQLDVLADAQQGQVYVQTFGRQQDGSPYSQSELQVLHLTSWIAGTDPHRWISGPGLTVYGQQIPAERPRIAQERWQPTLASLLQLGREQAQREQFVDPFALEPLYRRRSSAEEKRDARRAEDSTRQ